MLKAAGILRKINRYAGLLCGVVLLVTAAFVLAEITLRGFGLPNLRGAEEISGYVMAGVTAWGMSLALTERAHIRIEIAVSKLQPLWRSVFDAAAPASAAVIAGAVTVHGHRVLSKSLESGSRANTPLETPLWIPQAVWLSGWAWFSVTALIIAVIAFVFLVTGRSGDLRGLTSVENEAGADL